MKSWRYETRPPVQGAGINNTRWGPWRTVVEVHQVNASLVTDAFVADRICFLRHWQPKNGIIIGEFPAEAIPASITRGSLTWGQGLNAKAAVTAATELVINAAIPFQLYLNVGEVLDIQVAQSSGADFLAAPILMVRDIDDVKIGR